MFLSGNMPAAKEKAPEPSDSETSSYEEVEEEDTTAAWALAAATPKSAATAPAPKACAHTVEEGTDTDPSSSDSPDPRKDREPAPEAAGESSDSRAGLSRRKRGGSGASSPGTQPITGDSGFQGTAASGTGEQGQGESRADTVCDMLEENWPDPVGQGPTYVLECALPDLAAVGHGPLQQLARRTGGGGGAKASPRAKASAVVGSSSRSVSICPASHVAPGSGRGAGTTRAQAQSGQRCEERQEGQEGLGPQACAQGERSCPQQGAQREKGPGAQAPPQGVAVAIPQSGSR